MKIKLFICYLTPTTYLYYGRGNKDDWCLYIHNPDNYLKDYAPKDVEYLGVLKQYAEKYGEDKIQKEISVVYNLSRYGGEKGKDYKFYEDCSIIGNMVLKNYATESERKKMCLLYMTLLATMNAEYYYPNTVLNKKIKALAIYQVVHLHMDAETVANYSRGIEADGIEEKLVEYDVLKWIGSK